MSELMTLNDDQQYELMKKQAGAFFRSKLFPDLNSHEQAVVKVMAGKEMGVAPFAALKGIFITKEGKAEMYANLMAAIICNHPRFSYRVITANAEICEIDFYDSSFGKEKVGTASFAIEEAQRAGLLSKNTWKCYPSDMLFARALSRGARRFCPGAFGGIPVYVVGETESEPSKVELLTKSHLEENNAVQIEYGKPLPAHSHEVINLVDTDKNIIDEILETHVISEGGL